MKMNRISYYYEGQPQSVTTRMFTISLEAFDFTIPLLLTSLHSFSPQALVFQYLFEEEKVPIFSFD